MGLNKNARLNSQELVRPRETYAWQAWLEMSTFVLRGNRAERDVCRPPPQPLPPRVG